MISTAGDAPPERAAERPADLDRGASLVEYALLVALLALVCFAAVDFFGQSTNSTFVEAGSSFASLPGN